MSRPQGGGAGPGTKRRSLLPPAGLPVAVLAASVLAAPLPAQAGRDEGRILSPSDGESLVAGQAFEVRWSPLPADVEEMEFLLSVDGGRFFPFRLTPRIDPRSGSFVLSVPRIDAASARLRIRFGRNGREIDGESSATFSILDSPLIPPAPFLRRDGEWWIARDGRVPPPPSGISGSATLEAARDAAAQVALPSPGERLQTPPASSAQDPTSRGAVREGRSSERLSRAAPEWIGSRRE